MKYYKLVDRMDVPGRWHIGVLVDDEGWEPSFLAGARFVGRRLTASDDGSGSAVDFSLTSFGVPIVSEGLRSDLESLAGDDVQWVPVSVSGRVGYFVLNVLRLVRCLDESRSEFVKWTVGDGRPDRVGGYRSVSKPVLDVTM